MLEKMGEFFDNRLDGYDEHQLSCIECAREFLQFTANCLPTDPDCAVLDLGCGTGLELESYFHINPSARVTGIDLAPGMLNRLKDKLPQHNIDLVLGSYFDVRLAKRFLTLPFRWSRCITIRRMRKRRFTESFGLR